MRTVSIKLPPELDSRLSALVADARTTRSRLIREIIERHLRERPPTEDSALSRAGDLVGSVGDAPRDLSTNRRYLRNLGK